MKIIINLCFCSPSAEVGGGGGEGSAPSDHISKISDRPCKGEIIRAPAPLLAIDKSRQLQEIRARSLNSGCKLSTHTSLNGFGSMLAQVTHTSSRSQTLTWNHY